MNNLGEETCICCGMGIPEGLQVCPACERKIFKSPYIGSDHCWCGGDRVAYDAQDGGVYTKCERCGTVVYYGQRGTKG